MNYLAKKTGWTLRQLPKRYRVDFVRVDETGTCLGWVEYKARSRKYPTLMISTAKLVEGLTLSDVTGLPFFLLVSHPGSGGFPNDLSYHYIEITEGYLRSLQCTIGGRRGRGQDSDIEPVHFIPMDEFIEIW